MKKLLSALILFVCFNKAYAQNPLEDSSATVTVSTIVDGDTFRFEYADTVYTVRILGIDCYETREGKRLDKQAKRRKIDADSALSLGMEAKEFARKVLLGREVTLVRISRNFDVYKRLLRRVYIGGEEYSTMIKQRGLSVESGAKRRAKKDIPEETEDESEE